MLLEAGKELIVPFLDKRCEIIYLQFLFCFGKQNKRPSFFFVIKAE